MPGTMPARLCENCALMLPLDLKGPFPGVLSSCAAVAMLAMTPLPSLPVCTDCVPWQIGTPLRGQVGPARPKDIDEGQTIRSRALQLLP